MSSSFNPTEITLSEIPDSPFKELVGSALTFTDEDGTEWAAPLSTLTDGASVPRLALAVTDGRFDAQFLKAAVVHDAYCQEENAQRRPPYRSRPWKQTHRMFLQACIAGGTPRRKAYVMYAAVRWFGPRWDDPEGEARQVSPDVGRTGFAATKHKIETTEPNVQDIDADVEWREPLIRAIHDAQMAAISATVAGDRAQAEALLAEVDPAISAGLKHAPDDLMFQNLQGYQHKNWAMVDRVQAADRLVKAEEMFRNVLAVEPRDASALNGLGSVALLRGDLDVSLSYILQALLQEPDYPAAWHDLDTVRRAREQR